MTRHRTFMSLPDFLLPDEVPLFSENDSPNWTLPNGQSVRGWMGNRETFRRKIYLWFVGEEVPGVERGSVCYRVFPYGNPSGEWLPLRPAKELLRPTFDDPDPTEDLDPFQLREKVKLAVGHYEFVFRLSYEGHLIELRGGDVRVFRTEQEAEAHLDETMRQLLNHRNRRV